MKLYYVVALCTEKIAERNMTIIYSLESIDSIPFYKCNTALRSFIGHKKYPYNIEDGGFIIKEAFLLHENGHKDRFEEFKNDYFFIWESEIETFRRVCTTYVDIFEARKGGLNMYIKAFEKYYKNFKEAHDKLFGLNPKNISRKNKEEERVNNRPEMLEVIDLYIKKLKEHCHLQ